MKTHELKTWPIYFEGIWNNHKKFELRKNDRDFQVGDSISLREYLPITDIYSGRTVVGTITYLLTDIKGLSKGYCIFGFDVFDKHKRREV